jgi:hypothetical protein
MKLSAIANRLPAAGFGLGAIAWGVSTQLNYALAPKVCLTHWPLVPVVSLLLALIGVAGLALSLAAWRADASGPSVNAPTGGRPHKLLAAIGVMAGALFTLIILLHGVAGLILGGCE